MDYKLFLSSVIILIIAILFMSNKIRILKEEEVDNEIFNLSRESSGI